ncbi:MAG TPA: hypothetical protein VFK09_00555 [Gemmatimonadales bacterium]|nr:hypothetical protein [Gemmatimonadales bacterium]
MIKAIFWSAAAAVALMLPGALEAQTPVTLVCKDGTQVPGPTGSACSAHGGVDRAATDAATQARGGVVTQKPDTVVCMDGSAAAAGPSACASQGGVDSVATRAAMRRRARGEAATGRPSMTESTTTDTSRMNMPGMRDTSMQRHDST